MKKILFLLSFGDVNSKAVKDKIRLLQVFLENYSIDDKQENMLGLVDIKTISVEEMSITTKRWKDVDLSPFLDYKAVICLDSVATSKFLDGRYFDILNKRGMYKGIPIYPVRIPSNIGEFEMFATNLDNIITEIYGGVANAPSPNNYTIVRTLTDFANVLDLCKTSGVCSFDVETNQIDDGKDNPVKYYMKGFKVRTLSISSEAGVSYVVPLEHAESPFSRKDCEFIVSVFNSHIFENPAIIKVAHNLKYDICALSSYAKPKEYVGRYADTMLMAHLIDENEPVNLDSLVKRYLPHFAGYKITDYNRPLEELAKYNGEDTDYTLRLFYHFELRLQEDIALYKYHRNLQMTVFWTLLRMEQRGCHIDRAYLETSIQECMMAIQDKKQQFYSHPDVVKFSMAKAIEEYNYLKGEYEANISDPSKRTSHWETKLNELKMETYEVNLNSPKQLSELFYKHPEGLNLVAIDEETGEKTDSTSHDILVTLNHDIIDIFMDYRMLEKVLKTFFLGIKNGLDENNILRGSFNLIGTKSGRLSCVTYDTKIRTEKGDIEIGSIIPFNEGSADIKHLGIRAVTHTGEYKLITHGINKGKGVIYKITFTNGVSLKATKDHKVLTDKGWRYLEDVFYHKKKLSVKYLLYQTVYEYTNNIWQYYKIKDIERLDGLHTICDITVEDNHSYISNGFVSHNCSDPNLQNLITRTKSKDEVVTDIVLRVKKLFIPFTSFEEIMQSDFSQLELRLIAMFSGDKNMIKAYKDGMDLHSLTASQINNMGYEEFSATAETNSKWFKLQRFCGKGGNFSLSYGCMPQTYRLYVKGMTGAVISQKDAEKHHANYFKAYPSMLVWHETYKQKARKFGYVRTFFGRKRRLPDIHNSSASLRSKAERQAVNTPVQGSGGEIALFSLVLIESMCDKFFPNLVKLINTVHDSYVSSNRKDISEKVGKVQQYIVENLANVIPDYFEADMNKWVVPLKLDVEAGENWRDAK